MSRHFSTGSPAPGLPDQVLSHLVRLLARQAARDLVSGMVPGSSADHAANNEEHRHGADDEQDR